jgi:3-keto-disaccharide hydrolase
MYSTSRALALAAGLFVIALSAVPFSQPVAGQTGPGWVQLFDGKSLNGWTPMPGVEWRVEDGALVADKKTVKGNPSLVSNTTYKDFQIYAEVWVSEDANSGIYIRATDPKNVSSRSAYEVNLYDNRPGQEYSTGAIQDVAAVKLPAPKAGGKWNTLEITAKGPLMSVVFNGVKTSEGQDEKYASGPIGLQYGRGVVKFRKVAIKPL